jgi:hypothetical protein
MKRFFCFESGQPSGCARLKGGPTKAASFSAPMLSECKNRFVRRFREGCAVLEIMECYYNSLPCVQASFREVECSSGRNDRDTVR